MLTAADLIGSWTLLAAYLELPGGERSNYLGPDPKGRIILDPSGHMVALLMARERSGDRAELFGSMLAYTGTYTADDASFVTTVDAAWHPAWEGSEQRRHYVIAGDRLTIHTPPGPHPDHPGQEVSAVLEWRREG